jgi:4'-phosphopantetheinyl transferase
VRQTTVEGVRIAWAPVDAAGRRESGRSLIRALAAALAPGADPRIEQRCASCGGPHGRLVLPGAPLVASVAYAAGWVIVAVARSDEYATVGIDAELDAEMPDLTALFAPRDPPDLRGWTAIEAVLKADGRGLVIPPDQVLCAPDGRATVPPGAEYRVIPVHAEPRMIVTLAVSAPLTVVERASSRGH